MHEAIINLHCHIFLLHCFAKGCIKFEIFEKRIQRKKFAPTTGEETEG
jgi:hypothetical protein